MNSCDFRSNMAQRSSLIVRAVVRPWPKTIPVTSIAVPIGQTPQSHSYSFAYLVEPCLGRSTDKYTQTSALSFESALATNSPHAGLLTDAQTKTEVADRPEQSFFYD